MRKRKLHLMILIISIMGLLAVALGILSYYNNQKYKEAAQDAQNTKSILDSNTQSVYIATKDIPRGTMVLTDEKAAEANTVDPAEQRDEETAAAVLVREEQGNISKTQIYTSLDAQSYMSDLMVGYYAVVDIPAGTPIMPNMIRALDITNDTREYELSAVSLAVDQTESDLIDIRIMYPNGEDYVVLAQKSIHNLSLKNMNFWTYMDEEEILRYTSAVIDAYQTTGARIYSTRYVESNLQSPAIPNYLVKSETIDLLRSDPNIYAVAEQTMNEAARMSLEVRLGQLSDDQLAAVAAGFGLVDTAKTNVLSDNVDLYSGEIATYGLDEQGTGEEWNEGEAAEGTDADTAGATDGTTDTVTDTGGGEVTDNSAQEVTDTTQPADSAPADDGGQSSLLAE